MIRILNKYYTKSGRIVTPLSFSGGFYNCQMTNGQKVKLKPDEMFEENPRKKKPKIENPIVDEVPVIPDFIFDDEIVEIKKQVDKIPEIQDNIEETAEEDFYADL